MSEKQRASCYWIILSGLLLTLLWPVAGFSLEPGRVLLISSYHPGFPTFFHQIQGVKSSFSGKNILLDVEFMDSKRFAGESSSADFLRMLSGKLKKLPAYDVVMTADDNALNFLLEHKEQLFPSQPAVFFGVNNVAKALTQNENASVTGVVEAVSMRETIELMTHLQPAAKTILALVDATPSGQGDLVYFNEMKEHFPELSFRSLSLEDFSFAEFANHLRQVGEDSAVLLLSAYVDTNGDRLNFQDSLDLILENLNQPVFHLWYHGVGDGLLGGKVISHLEQGKAAAEIVLRLFGGEDVAQIPVVAESPNQIIFDYTVLKKFGLEKIALPDNTLLLNKPISFYEGHKVIIWLVGAFCLFQSIVIIFLIHTIIVRREVEAELRESEERYFSLFAENHSVMLLIDPQTIRIVDANPAACRYYGYALEELVGEKVSIINILPEEDIRQRVDDVQQGKYSWILAKQRLASGEIREVEIYSGPITLHGQQLLYSIVHDITDRRKLEEQLRQAQKMEALGTLAGGIAHDFNNILAAMLGYAELARDEQPADSKTRDYLENVLVAGDRAKELVRHILAFSRKGSESRGPVPIYNVVEEVLQLLRASLPTTIEIRSTLEKSCGYVIADSTQLHQVVLNLCTNAAQAMEEHGGILSIDLARCECSEGGLPDAPELTPGAYVRLVVSDTGTGMPPELLDRIFDPYFTTKKVGKGSGMGLAVVSGIVKNHGGTIHAVSESGKGARFSVYFPRIAEPDQMLAQRDGDLPSGKGHILLVDDEAALIDVMRQKIERLGYTVTAKTNSIEALELFRSDPHGFDLLLTDQTMPGMTGLEFARKVKAIRSEIPVIISTGYSSKIDMEQASQQDIDAVFMKPVDNSLLAKTLRGLLNANS